VWFVGFVGCAIAAATSTEAKLTSQQYTRETLTLHLHLLLIAFRANLNLRAPSSRRRVVVESSASHPTPDCIQSGGGSTMMANRCSLPMLRVLFIACCLYAGRCSGFLVDRSTVNSARTCGRGSRSMTRQCFIPPLSEGARATMVGSGNGNLLYWSRRRVRMLANQPEKPDEPMEFVGDDAISDQAWEEIEAGAPSELSIMKEVGRYHSRALAHCTLASVLLLTVCFHPTSCYALYHGTLIFSYCSSIQLCNSF